MRTRQQKKINFTQIKFSYHNEALKDSVLSMKIIFSLGVHPEIFSNSIKTQFPASCKTFTRDPFATEGIASTETSGTFLIFPLIITADFSVR